MILDVFSKAGVNIDGLEELEVWKALKDLACVIDPNEFVSELAKSGETHEQGICLKPNKFAEICKQFSVDPAVAKRALHKKGLIKATSNGKKD